LVHHLFLTLCAATPSAFIAVDAKESKDECQEWMGSFDLGRFLAKGDTDPVQRQVAWIERCVAGRWRANRVDASPRLFLVATTSR
jgi:hypothetical protein